MSLSDKQFAFTFDDFMLVPGHSHVTSRKQPDTSSQVGSVRLQIPVISAPMNTVTEDEMSVAMAEIGADGVLHRYLTIDQQADIFRKINGVRKPWVAVGATGDYLQRARTLYKKGARRFCIDVANGHSEICCKAARMLSEEFPDADLMAGNVCTYEGARMLALSGANVIRVGIGPGSMCTTRLVTGHGVPQLSALESCVRVKEDIAGNIAIVADGGIRTAGDIVKAMAIGADAVMVGGLLAGTSQSPGDTMRDEDGNLYKMYHGMASEEGRKNWFDKEATAFVPEGSSTRVAFKGCAKRIVETLAGGLRVGMSFTDAKTLEELREKAVWVRVTENGRVEGTPNRRMHKR